MMIGKLEKDITCHITKPKPNMTTLQQSTSNKTISLELQSLCRTKASFSRAMFGKALSLFSMLSSPFFSSSSLSTVNPMTDYDAGTGQRKT